MGKNFRQNTNYYKVEDVLGTNRIEVSHDELFLWYNWPTKGVKPYFQSDHCHRSSP